MKMRFWDRFLTRLGALLTFVAGGAAVAAGILLYGHDLGEGLVMKSLPVALIIAGAVVVLVSIYNLLMPRRYASGRHNFVTIPTELGELRIAVPAIENLIQQCVETHKEVKVQDMRISTHRGAVNVGMRVSMNSNVSIPHAVEQLQTQIKRYLAASSGIEVRDINVSVVKAVGDESALPVEPLITEAEMEKSEEKIPMHQRIFGRDPEKSEAEQIAEAEMIPTPEKETSVEEGAPADAENAEPAEESAEEETVKTEAEHE